MESSTTIKNPNNNNHADNHLINNQPQQVTSLQNNNLTVSAQPFTPAANNNNGNNTNNNNLTVQQSSNAIAPAQSYTPVPAAAAAPLHSVAATSAGHPIYNQAMHSPNMFVPAPGVHQAGPMYAAMMPAQIPSNVYVNNVTANVNLHGWAHTVPAYIPGGAPHYIQGDMPPDQNPSVLQAIPGMPVALAPSNAIVAAGGNGNLSTQMGTMSSRGSRRGRGRGGSGGSRRGDYNNQRHPPPEGSPAPQPQMVQTQDQIGQQQSLTQQQQSQQIDSSNQLMATAPPSYAAQPQYAHPSAYAAYPYQAYFAAQNPILHPAQAAQQATGTPLYVSHMPMYNAPPVYNYMGSPFVYPPVMNPPEYQFLPGEDGQCDERQNPEGMVAPMWHAQPIYADEYGMNPEMHNAGEDINHNASSMGSVDTPSMLSPNYAIYDPQIHEVQQHMGMMHIYEDPQITQMTQMPGMHPEAPVAQLEEEIVECVAQPGAIQMVSSGTMITAGSIQMSNETQIIHHSHAQHQSQHIIQNAVLEVKPHHSSESENVNVENSSPDEISELQAVGSVTSLTEIHTHQSTENIVAEDYQAQQQQQQLPLPQQQQQITQSPPKQQLQQQPAQKQASAHFNSQNVIDMPPVVVAATEVYHHHDDNVPKEEATEVPVATVAPAAAPPPAPVAVHAAPQQQQQQQQAPTVAAVVAAQPVATAVASVSTATNVPTQQQQIQTSPPLQKYHHQQQQQPQQQQTHQQTHPKHQQQSYNRYDQQQQHHSQQYHHQQNHSYQYEQRRPQQNYNNNQSRRKYDYNNQSYAPNNNNNNNGNNNNDTAIQTTKTMSWTNSSKKSTASVAVTATPNSYNNSNNSNNQNRTYGHSTRTYTNHGHNYQQQSHYHQQHQQQQQQHGGHYNQPQMRNAGGMKMPPSPVSGNNAPSQFGNNNANDRRNSQAEQPKYANHGNNSSYNNYNQYGNNSGSSATNSSNVNNAGAAAATSTASTTAAPQHFPQQQQHQTQQQQQVQAAAQHQQQTAAQVAQNQPQQQQQALVIDSKQYPGFTSSKKAAAAAAAATTAAAAATTMPIMNLAPPITANTNTTAPSTQSWASLFNDTNNANVQSTSASGAQSSSNNSNTNASIQNSNSSPALPPPFSSKKPVAKVAPYECVVPAPVNPTPPVVLPGAMSYSAASAQGIPPQAPSAAKALVKPEPPTPTVRANLDEYTLKFADFLTKSKTDLSTVSLRPRGLTNPSNYCYINSILQALLGCAPFYNLIRSIPKQAAALSEVRTPTVNALISFVSQFSTLPSGMRLRTNKGPKGKDDLGSELQCDSAFEPSDIYRLWIDSREEYVEGRQEDAEEFLSYVLNKLNDEMLEVIKLVAKPNAEQNGRNEVSESEDGDEWQMICNNRNKGSVTRQQDFGRTPLSDIFRGELRSRLQREGEHSTDDIQPFFTLQLNIEKAASVKEALEILVGRDQLEGVTGSKTKQEVVAWQQMTLEKLPTILILHLKWFDYRSDGCTKILKKVEFPVDLKIDAKILASKKYSMKQRAYRLFAVVYHDGKEATKGHYITDVYHTGYSSWLRYNDSSVKPVSENEVLYPKTPRVPYLLYYRRCDTMPQQNNSTTGGQANAHTNAAGNHGGRDRDGNK
ncbi:PREDICTED: homeobox protein 5 [Bactrocera latifrons]|uniref:homeobox protein 5 n=1 Tax=Bactrocera latifrons TaxID=174628 RepID=UPI0008DCC16C|nr:PREDICTED: homeobox protein 5 [Bactrocera latifrons]XP_018804404.1 PREDICTED: homeobox protein 5 [Bactrocera latifrons]